MVWIHQRAHSDARVPATGVNKQDRDMKMHALERTKSLQFIFVVGILLCTHSVDYVHSDTDIPPFQIDDAGIYKFQFPRCSRCIHIICIFFNENPVRNYISSSNISDDSSRQK